MSETQAEYDGHAEAIARGFHERYERLAPEHGYATREASAKPWEDVPEQNKGLMVAVVRALLADGVIAVGYLNTAGGADD